MARASIREALFGKLATRGRLITEEQLAECLEIQRQYEERGGEVPRLGEILAMKSYMSPEQVRAVLEGQHTRREGLFGEIVVRWRLAEREVVAEALALQREMDAAGKSRRRTGEILVERGALQPHHVLSVLEAQDKRVVHCSGCNTRFNAAHVRPGARLHCPRCGAETVLGMSERHVTTSAPLDVAGTVWVEEPVAAPEEPEEAEPGRPEIAGYEILSRLGSDGTGTVCRARHAATDTVVSLKLMRPSPMRSREFLNRFLAESRRGIWLDHPNLKKVYEVGRSKGRYFISSEFVEGKSLKRRLEQAGRLKPAEAVEIALAVAEALRYGHEQGIWHGDVRPSNVLLSADGSVKLAGLGMAKDVALNLKKFTKSSEHTPFYLPPEEAVDEGSVDACSDVYSLGATLYHMVTGRPPYVGQSPLEILMRLTSEELTPPHEINPNLPRRLSDLIVRMLAPEPEDRPQSMDAVIEELEAIRSRIGPAPRPAAAPTTHATSPHFAARRALLGGRRRRGKGPAMRTGPIVVGAILVGLVLAGALLLFSRPGNGGGRETRRDETLHVREESGPLPAEQVAREDYEAALSFAQTNPRERREAAKRFAEVAEKHPGTEYGRRARTAQTDWLVRALRDGLRQIELARREAFTGNDYANYLAQIEAWLAEAKALRSHADGAVLLERGRALRAQVVDAENAYVELRVKQALDLAEANKFAEARQLLSEPAPGLRPEAALRLAGAAGRVDQAEAAHRDRLAEERRQKEERLRQLREAHEKARVEYAAAKALAGAEPVFLERLKAGAFADASGALLEARRATLGTDADARCRALLAAVEMVQTFLRHVDAEIASSRVESTVHFKGRVRRVRRVTAGALTVEINARGDTTEVPFGEVDAKELVAVAVAAIRPGNAEDAAGLALFAHLRGDAERAKTAREATEQLKGNAEAVKAVLDPAPPAPAEPKLPEELKAAVPQEKPAEPTPETPE